MLLETILLLVALVGSTLAAIIDLKTTEIPDQIPYIMMGAGIVGNLLKSYLVGSYSPIALSLLIGLGFLGFGFVLYYTGQWGGGDAKILSAIGFLLPQLSINKSVFPFPLSLFLNVFFIGSFYMIGYMIVMALFNNNIISSFLKDLKESTKELLLLNLGIIIFLFLFDIYVVNYLQIISIQETLIFDFFVILMAFGLFILWRFAKTVEKIGFKKKVKISEVKEGDVLEDSKVWDGLTKEQVKKLQKSDKKHVVIKEGVRFAPTFPIALLVTVFFGDFVLWLTSLI